MVSGHDARHRCGTGLSFSNRSHRYSPEEKLYSVTLLTAGLSILSVREMKEGTKRFYNNVSSKKLKSIEDSERNSADSRSRKDRREGNTNLTVPIIQLHVAPRPKLH
jgi:thymidylate synthase ThyX